MTFSTHVPPIVMGVHDGSMAADGASLGAVLDQLDRTLISAVDSLADERAPVREIVLWDALEPLPAIRDGVLLLVGCAPTHPSIAETIAEAGRLGYAAVALKFRGAQPTAATDAAARAGVALLCIADDVAWTSVESLLVAAIAVDGGGPAGRFGNRATSDLFDLANTVATLTDAAITIEDVDRNVLAYSNVPGQPIDSSRQNSILGRSVADLPEHVSEYRELAHSSGPVQFAAYGGTLARVVMPVRVGGRLIGSIWAVDADGEQGERIAGELVAVAPQVALHLLRAANRTDLERHRRSELLTEELSSPGTTGHNGGRITRQQLPVALMGFRPVHEPGSVVDAYRLTNLIALNVESSCRDASCAQVGETIFVLLPRVDRFAGGWAERLAASTMRSVAGALRVDIGCAYASAISTHEAVPSARTDIDTALRRQTATGRAGPVDIVRERYVVQLQTLIESEIASPGQLIPQVAEIIEHDRVHGSSYSRTLLTHLDCLGDVRRAADALFVHENSHRYRMRKLVAQFGIDLDNPELRLVIWLQLRIAVGDRTRQPAADSGPQIGSESFGV